MLLRWPAADAASSVPRCQSNSLACRRAGVPRCLAGPTIDRPCPRARDRRSRAVDLVARESDRSAGGVARGAHWPQPADARGGARAASRPTGDDARGARGYARVASGETETRARLRLLDSTLRLRSAELHPALQPPFS